MLVAMALSLTSFGVRAQNVTISVLPTQSEVAEIASLNSDADLLSLSAQGSVLNDSASIQVAKKTIPVNLTAKDFVTKVYGVISPEKSKNELCEDCRNILNLMPSEDEMGLWLDSSEGFYLNYYGQTVPDVSVMAALEGDSVANFGFFFLFPYNSSDKDEICRKQALFCGSLMQELQDIGAIMDLNPSSDNLFEACGNYNGNFVDVKLLDKTTGASAGRYVLYMMVEPNAFTSADNLAAL